ncbi:helix-turn-helix domain-containing protein [Brochothrix campestris]|uniref:helix-turn-helix domain-containing protein n=1 Tax=Brochothrix campestris TaxID=2757 RepID=UPI0038D0A98C
MHKILDKQEGYSLQCLRYFARNKRSTSIDLQKMSEALDWNRRALAKNLDCLQDDIQKNDWGTHLNFTYNTSSITLEISPLFSIDFFATHYIETNIQFQFCHAIFNDEFVSFQDFTDNNFITKATMYRKLNRLKELLEAFEVSLDLTKHERLIGEEHQIRYFFYCLFTDAYHFLTDFAHNVDSNLLDDLLANIHAHTPLMPYSSLLKLRTFLAITISRIKQGFILDHSSPLPDISTVILTKTDVEAWVANTFSTVLGLTDEQVAAEVNGMHFMISTLNVYPLAYFENINFTPFNAASLFKVEAEQFINCYCDYFNKSLTATEYAHLQVNLIAINAHIKHVKGSEHNSRMQLNLKTVMERHPLTFETCASFFTYLEEQTHIVLNNASKVQYFLLLRDAIRFMHKPLRVCLLSKITDSQHVFLKTILQQSTQIPLQFIPYPDETVDLYISDFQVQHLEERYPNALFYFWSSMPEEQEWVYILDILHKTYHEKGVATLITTQKKG